MSIEKSDEKMDKQSPIIIAVCGKGGVGKTFISAAITRLLCSKPEARVLAIDADPAIGLALALGIEPRKTVDDVRKEFTSKLGGYLSYSKQSLTTSLGYELFAALEERDNSAFLAVGRPEGEGCYCAVNTLLRNVIEATAANFDYVVIDGEAGMEQLNRRVFRSVTHLLLVSDMSTNGLNVVRSLRKLADDAIQPEWVGCILNRVRDGQFLRSDLMPEDVASLIYLPEDDAVREGDTAGTSVFDLPMCPALEGLKTFIEQTGIN